MIFTLLIAFMVNHSQIPVTAVTPGQYYEVVKVQYDATVDKTYGVFARYGVDVSGGKSMQHLQLRNVPGNKPASELIKNAPHDANVTLIGE